MKYQDILTQLTYGEFSQLFIGAGSGGSSNGMPDDASKTILPSVKLGLTELHKRFLLRERNFTIGLDGRNTYLLTTDFAVTNADSTEAVKYIQDTADNQYTGDLMKIDRILDDDDNELEINIVGSPTSIRTTSYNVILLPDDLLRENGDPVTELHVFYHADHPPIDESLAEADPASVEIYLPTTHMEALLCFVASRKTTPLGIAGEFHSGNNYFAKFEAAVLSLRNTGMSVDTNRHVTKLYDRGFV